MALFAERGFAGVSIRDIAGAADVSSSLVVHHFGTKAGLQAAIEARAIALVTDVLGQAAAAAGGDITPAATAQILATAMRELDPGEVGLEQALANLNERLSAQRRAGAKGRPAPQRRARPRPTK